MRTGPALPDEPQERRTGRPARAATGRSTGASAADRAAARRGTSSVAVLDREDEPEPGSEVDDATDGVIDDALASNARVVDDEPADTDERDDGDVAPPAAPRRRSTPAGGSAAERAAARRARQRAERDEKGEF